MKDSKSVLAHFPTFPTKSVQTIMALQFYSFRPTNFTIEIEISVVLILLSEFTMPHCHHFVDDMLGFKLKTFSY